MDPDNHSPDVVADAVLIDRIRSGDVQAYGTLVERYERGVLAAVLPIVRGDLHAAQDVVQDVFVQCYLKLAGLRDGSRFGWWITKAARRQAIRASRRIKPMRAVGGSVDVPADVADTLDADEHQQLLNCVRQLPKHERLMVSLRFFDGHSVKEIAAMTGRPVGTVTKQLSRALQRLRDQFQTKVENQPCPPQQTMKQSAVL